MQFAVHNCDVVFITNYAVFKNVLFSCPRQVYFPAGQVTFHLHLSDGKTPGNSSANWIKIEVKPTCLGQAKLRAACLKAKLEKDNTYLNQ